MALCANRTGRQARALAAVTLCLYFVPVHAQGIGPPDLGIFNYVILGAWLLAWLSVFIYPIALVVYFFQRQSDAWAKQQDGDFVAPSRGPKIFKWSVKIHVGLTLGGLLFFALD